MKRGQGALVSGFTIVEVLITVALIGIIAAVGFGFNFFVDSYKLGRDTFLYVYVYSDMQRKALNGIEWMIRGVNNYKGIQEAQEVSTPAVVGNSATEIIFVDGQDATILRRFYYSSTDKSIYYSSGGSTSKIIDGDVNSLIFKKEQDDLIEIDITLQRTALGKQIDINLVTSVKLRNR